MRSFYSFLVIPFTQYLSHSDDEDEESQEWEQEQLRRGGHMTLESRASTPKIKQIYKPAPSEILHYDLYYFP